ncbi:MAG: aminopeptidase N [Marinosulfonomonas sp.]|nr:aminopeptidase N [Marinosulfonomonas sp.]
MKNAAAQTIHLSDYTPFSHIVNDVSLTFRLSPKATRVISRISFAPKPGTEAQDLFLNGENLKLISACIDGVPVSPDVTEKGLTIAAADLPDAPFIWEAEVQIDPASNTALEGLYMSNGMYCTQCEAEGFRKITYYPDRPDVMSVFTVRVEGDGPVLLSNGNPTDGGDGWAEWHDPWPKPAYLFALVAGDLVAHSANFTTASGKPVDLNIWVRPGDEDKCAYAMDALIRSMKWDETVYGREYDLDVFNIVAVDDFNMGAMENKGLNIFNSKYVLASPETATDMDYELIEGIIAHEYFHNWTGNRITCRDWFQLCLKEGLTVFRDQQFSGDMRSHAVKRIEDVLQLRARQFREDTGPLAHPVRPESFVEINNFYTATVYEKGAEVIGMMKTLVGDAGYEKALNLYFERHDGDAATIEDWLTVFQDATGRDLSQFKRWYSQAGTPRLTVTDDFKDGQYSLTIEQKTPPTPGQNEKQPQHIPVAVGLLNPNGDEVVPTSVLELTEARQTFTFDNLAARPVPSILRGFSAPVIVSRKSDAQERALLLAHDTDPFNKWEAGRALAKDALTAMIVDDAAPDAGLLDALAAVAVDSSLDPAFRALALALPGEDDMAQTLYDAGVTPDPSGIHIQREALLDALARRLEPDLPGLFTGMAVPGPYTPDAVAAGKRSLRATALALITRLDGGAAAQDVYDSADNMTEQLGALGLLVPTDHGPSALAQFHEQWKGDRLVMDKWFLIQPARADPDKALAITKQLETHENFNWKNPNRLRALIYGLASANPAAFHQSDGAAYAWFADWIIRIDPANPQVAARSLTMFDSWRRYDADRQGMMRTALARIKATANLSPDATEMVTRILGD